MTPEQPPRKLLGNIRNVTVETVNARAHI